ncbi:MAG: hypothetical protein Q8M94_14975 [Ignavibacteria bacterium]|nr:hypothetical protein [Ignavibacteria bacterium]
MFKIGDKVRVIVKFSDFYFFDGEIGTIIRINKKDDGSIKYLGVIVEFDEPMMLVGGYIKTIHNFHPEDLELIKK